MRPAGQGPRLGGNGQLEEANVWPDLCQAMPSHRPLQQRSALKAELRAPLLRHVPQDPASAMHGVAPGLLGQSDRHLFGLGLGLLELATLCLLFEHLGMEWNVSRPQANIKELNSSKYHQP